MPNLHTLKEGSQETVVSTEGGTVESWKVGGKDIFFPRQKIGDKTRGGMHQCFPNFGKISDEFGLPPHGPLRNTELTTTNTNGSLIMETKSDKLFGKENILSAIKITTSLVTSENIPSLEYCLTAKLEGGSPERAWVNPGFHPYFNVPEETAIIMYGREKLIWKWDGSLDLKYLPLTEQDRRNPIVIKIQGLCTVTMTMGAAFTESPAAGIVIWSDSSKYVCVEPASGPFERYGKDGCQKLQENHSIDFKCTFSVTEI